MPYVIGLEHPGNFTQVIGTVSLQNKAFVVPRQTAETGARDCIILLTQQPGDRPAMTLLRRGQSSTRQC